MKKKIISLVLASAVAVLSAVVLAGCGGKDYPVEIANCKIEKEPKNVVVLDAATADIMSFLGYDRKFAGRSNDVDQQNLSAAPSVGTASNPDINQIMLAKADLVLSNDLLSPTAAEKLKEKDVQVIRLQQAENLSDIETNYETIGSLIYEAKIRAKQTDRETEAQRQRVLADAQADAQRIREEAQAEAQKTLDDVQRQVDEKTREGKLQYIAVQEELSRIVDIFGQVQKQFMNSYRDIQKIVSEKPGDSFEALDPYENGEPEMENLEIFTSNDEEVK